MKFLIVDPLVQTSNSSYVKKLINISENEVTLVENGEDAIKLFKEDNFDSVITELILPGIDASKLVRTIKEINPEVSLYAYSYIKNSYDIETVIKAGADYYFLKSKNIDDVICRIMSGCNLNSTNCHIENFSNDLRKIVPSVLREFGIPVHLKGYLYLIEAIISYLTDNDNYKCGMTKWVYPFIARKYKTKPTCVERAIRHAICTAWENQNSKNLKLFAATSSNITDRPTNLEFIAITGEYIKSR